MAKLAFYIALSLLCLFFVIRKLKLSALELSLLFFLLYVLLLYTYNSDWAWMEFPRFFFPALPVGLYAMRDYLPRNRILILVLAILLPALYGASNIGVRDVWAMLFQ